MNKNKFILRLYIRLVVPGLLIVTSACTALGTDSSSVQGLLQLQDGIIKVQSQSGQLEPLATESTFELVGVLESTDPWKVAGRALQRNEATEIAHGLNVGDRVRVKGAVLEDGTWLTYSIEPAAEPTTGEQTITMIGKATSVDPWVVNGHTLEVTGDTVINGEITPGMLAKVDVLVLEDGTWEVISISPAANPVPTDGCVNVVATVENVTGDQVKFLGWPTNVTVGNDASTNDNAGVDLAILQPGQQVLAVVCNSEAGQLVITQITSLDAADGDNNNEDNSGNGEKVLVCHKPAKKGGHTLSIASAAVPAHLAHGDTMGACP